MLREYSRLSPPRRKFEIEQGGNNENENCEGRLFFYRSVVFRESRSDRRVPSINVDSALTVATMERIEQLVIDQGAQLWIEHGMAAFLERQSRSTVHR